MTGRAGGGDGGLGFRLVAQHAEDRERRWRRRRNVGCLVFLAVLAAGILIGSGGMAVFVWFLS